MIIVVGLSVGGPADVKALEELRALALANPSTHDQLVVVCEEVNQGVTEHSLAAKHRAQTIGLAGCHHIVTLTLEECEKGKWYLHLSVFWAGHAEPAVPVVETILALLEFPSVEQSAKAGLLWPQDIGRDAIAINVLHPWSTTGAEAHG